MFSILGNLYDSTAAMIELIGQPWQDRKNNLFLWNLLKLTNTLPVALENVMFMSLISHNEIVKFFFIAVPSSVNHFKRSATLNLIQKW